MQKDLIGKRVTIVLGLGTIEGIVLGETRNKILVRIPGGATTWRKKAEHLLHIEK